MNIKLYNISKDTKSLKLPTNLVYESNDCYYKENVSIDKPVIVLTGEVNTYTFNYVMLEGRYYFITDKVHVRNDHCEYSLEIDLLATYRSDILNSRQYVTRASKIDGHLLTKVETTDAFYPSIVHSDINYLSPAFRRSIANNIKFYILAIVGDGNDITNTKHAMGSVTYYLMDQVMLDNFIEFLYHDTTWEDISGFTSQLAKALYKPGDFVISCTGYCVDLPEEFGSRDGFHSTQEIKCGYFKMLYDHSVGGHLYIVDSKATVEAWCKFIIPRHPDIEYIEVDEHGAERLTYYDYAPFTKISFEFPTVSTCQIDMSKMRLSESNNAYILEATLKTSLIDGNTIIEFNNPTDILDIHPVSTEYGNVGIPITIAKTNVNVLGMVSSAVNTAGKVAMNVATENYAGAVGSFGTGIMSALPEFVPSVSTATSGKPSVIYYINGNYPRLIIERNYSMPHDVNHFGDPLCEPVTLSRLSGYVECKDAEIEIPGAFKPHIEAIKSTLNGGVYIE